MELFASPCSSRLATVPGTQHPNPAEMAPQSPSSKCWGTQSPHGGRRGWWGLSSKGAVCPCPSPLPGGCSQQPQPHMCTHWARRSCCHHTGGGSTFPSRLKSSFYLWKRQLEPGRPLPDSPAEPARATAGYHGDSIHPAWKVNPNPIVPKAAGTRRDPSRAAGSRGQPRRAGAPRQRRWPGRRRSNGSECP